MKQSGSIRMDEDNPEVTVFEPNSRYEAIRISCDSTHIYINPNTVIKAFLQVCEHDMKEDVLTAESIQTINKFLER